MVLGALRESTEDFLLPGGCVACRAWIPRRHPRELVCPGCRTRLARPGWPRCPRCHRPRGTGRDPQPVCLECAHWPDALERARYAFLLRPPATRLVHALKYDDWPELAAFMGGAVAEAVPDDLGEDALVVPIPTTARRVARRGYDQAHLLARVVARKVGRPLRHGLVRVRGGTSQTALPPDARRENVRGAFAPAGEGSGELNGRDILLIDDVLTTGATASEAASILSSAGARRVTLATFARALPDPARESIIFSG